ncbi:MAG TPA: hypothetical protein QGF58_29000 [Myxococcota bacterium]|nr:hypothetical protein [Myxococcota bacterium]
MIRLEPIGVFMTILALAVVATWPLATDISSQLLMSPTRFDGYGTVWLGEHFCRAFLGDEAWLDSDLVASPFGLDLRLADSFLYGLLFPVLRLGLSASAAFNAFGLLSITGTGLAGWWLARRALGTGPLAAMACALTCAFNSAMLNARIEGEIYLLAAFLLPLFAGLLLQAVERTSLRRGALAGVALGLLAWSSGYFAIDGAVIGTCIGISALLIHGRGALKPGVVAILVAVLVAAPVAWMVGSGLEAALESRFPSGHDVLANVAMDSASVSGLFAPYPATAHLRQGRVTYIGLAPLLFGCAALVCVPRRRVLPWLSIALTATVLALGPMLRFDDQSSGSITMPYAWLAWVSRAWLAYRMPIRFLLVSSLGLGALTALLLEQLRREGLPRTWRFLLLALVGVDALVMTGSTIDHTVTPAAVPVGYDHLSRRGAVLDLWGHDRMLLKYAGLSAYYQVEHGQPSLADFTRAGDAQSVLSKRLALALFDEQEERITELLSLMKGLGVSDVVLHPGSFVEADALQLRAALRTRLVLIYAPDDADDVEVFVLPKFIEAMPAEDAQEQLRMWMDAS